MNAVRTVLTMTVKEGCEERFEKVWRDAAPRIAAFPGNLSQTLARPDGDDRVYVITSDWADPSALRAFETSPERVGLSERLEQLRESAHKSLHQVLVKVDGDLFAGYR